tara:strand:+ start:1702 stop:3036 length:1335 start_codon:yes stop_codon:yes gene_type:complete
MSQNDMSIANQTFPNTRSDINSALQALASTSSGTSAPSTTYANQLFYNTSSNLLQIRNEDNDAYITIAELDQSNDTVEYFKSDSVRTTLIEYSDGTDALTVGSSGALTTSSTLDVDGNELILDSDGDTSITADTDDQVDIKIGGTDRLSISSTGKVTSTQTGGANNFEIQTTSDNTLGADLTLYQNSASPADNDITSFISFAGNDSGGTKTTYSQIRGISADVTNTTEDGRILFLVTGGGTLSEKLRINGTGEILFGKTTNDFGTAGGTFNDTGAKNGALELIANGIPQLALNRLSSDGTAIVFHKDGSSGGNISVTASSTAYNTSSDYRLKENVDYSFDATTRLKQLKPCRFNWIIDETNTAVDGFIAHEVSSIVPEAITGTKDATKVQDVVDDEGVVTGTETVPDYQGIDQSKLVPLLVKTCQEQQTIIEDLQTRITALESN